MQVVALKPKQLYLTAELVGRDFSRSTVVEPPHAYEVSREMLARNIVIDYRENAGIRIAPHFYNTDDEVRLAINTMQDILGSGAWQQHAGRRDFVT